MHNLQTQNISLPQLGLGTFRMQGDECRAAVESGLALGYRHIDTAAMYGNEAGAGGRSLDPQHKTRTVVQLPNPAAHLAIR